MSDQQRTGRVKLAFERTTVTLALSQIVPLKRLREGVKSSKKYSQILGSIRAIGLIETPVVAPDPTRNGVYYLLDGHLRTEALKDLGIDTVDCLISTDDEAYTYNKHINRLSPVQEHRMITRAIHRGVPEKQIAEALGMEVTSVRRRQRMLDNICPDAVDVLKDTDCPMSVFNTLRLMAPLRQIEAAELMVGQNNFTGVFAKALLAATPDRMLVKPARAKHGYADGVTSEQIARMERELASLQNQVKSVEETYGVNNLHLTVARGYIRKLLSNGKVTRWLAKHRHEYLTEFQAIAEFDSLEATRVAAE